MMAHAGRHVGQINRLAGHVEFPAVIDAAQAAFLVASEKHVGPAMRTAPVEQADAALGVPEGDQLFAHHIDAKRFAVGVR